MKKFYYFAVALCTVALFSNCSKDEDLYDPNAAANKTAETENDSDADADAAKIAKNFSDIFGFELNPDQDWSMLNNSTVKVTAADESFKAVKAQVLTAVPATFKTKEESYGSEVLNEVTLVNGTATLNFDAPIGVDTLFVALVNTENQYRFRAFKVGDGEVTFGGKTAAARRFLAEENTNSPRLTGSDWSDNAKRTQNADKEDANMNQTVNKLWKGANWNDRIYTTQLKTQVIPNFTNAERTLMNGIISSNVPEYSNNTNRIKTSDIYYKSANYFTARGQREIQVTPMVCSAWFCGWEQLYYYYFPTSAVEGMSDAQKADYLKSLPKFKVCDVAETFANQQLATVEEKIADSRNRFRNMLSRVDKNHTYTLAYFGDGAQPNETGSYLFPDGLQIGFMLRIDSIKSADVSNGNLNRNLSGGEVVGAGELYADHLLNDEMNFYSGWKDANLGKNMSRAAIFGANGNNYVGFEDLRDDDFNDVIFEVTGGVEIIDESLMLDKRVYTLAFEDRKLGDYDLNDVVIRAQRIDLTHVKFILAATGAKDSLFLRNISGQKLNTTTEVHKIFGFSDTDRQFINTQSHNAEPVEETIDVPAGFTFAEDKYLPYIYNASQGYEVKLARKGEDPHGIVIPYEFKYPKERTCVGGKDKNGAYEKFNNWGRNKVEDTDWYKYPTEGRVFE